jgi:hypothetical protein
VAGISIRRPGVNRRHAALLKHSPNTTGAALACQHILTATELPDGLFTTLLVADPQVPAITERLIAACGGYFCFRWVRQSPIAARRRRCWAAAAYTDPIAPAPTTASFTPATLLRGRGRCLVGESATRRGFAWCRLASNSQVRAPLGAKTSRVAGSPKAGVAGSNPGGGTRRFRSSSGLFTISPAGVNHLPTIPRPSWQARLVN